MLLTDLSKAFECPPHFFLTARLLVYGFDASAISFIHGYLRDNKQRAKMKHSSRSWQNISIRVAKGSAQSTLGSLLSQIDICDLFSTMSNCKIATYADDNTLYGDNTLAGERTNKFDSSLGEASNVLLDWFRANQLQRNAGKRNALLSSKENLSINIGIFKIEIN